MSIEGLLGRKLGTLQVFDDKGRLRGATAVEIGPCFVTDIRTPEKHGYSAVQIGFYLSCLPLAAFGHIKDALPRKRSR